MMRTKLIIILLLNSLLFYSQSDGFSFKRDIIDVQNEWHRIVLPNDIFEKSKPNLDDLRIFGITQKSDTIEAPYLIDISQEKIDSKNISFELINQSTTKEGHYFTFKTAIDDPINQILLDFDTDNIDWRIALEGSHNQKEWFTILKDYRIVAIKNENTNYKFTTLNFPKVDYPYFRVFVNTREKAILENASIRFNQKSNLKLRDYTIKSIQTILQKETKESIINLTLDAKVPVSNIKLEFKDSFDYYRPVYIEYLADSIQTENGWIPQYKLLSTAVLSSFENNDFFFNSTQLQKLRIRIQNNDNQALTLDNTSIKGYIYELTARFNNPKASYYLAYGNPKSNPPRYDLQHISKSIPTDIITLQLDSEQLISKKTQIKNNPLFENKIWLWGIMLIIIFVLGWFSINMMRKT